MYKYLTLFLISFSVFSCDWSTIKEVNKDEYVYSKKCHIEVGKKLKELDLLKKESQNLRKAIEEYENKDKQLNIALKDLEVKSDMWRKESYDQYKYHVNQARLNRYENYMYFGAGAGLIIFSIFATKQITR
jgi:hypothetical protein